MKTNLLLAGFLLAAVAAPAATLYVDAGSTNPIAPYTNWPTAAAVIQDAVDAAAPGDEIIVTNGVYATGGRALAAYPLMTNRVCVDRAITLRSVNGPELTVIQGYQVAGTITGDGAIRCVYLTNGSVLSGFTLTNGATRASWNGYQESSGGGVWCEATNALAKNCVIAGNAAFLDGGGAYRVVLNACMLRSNSVARGEASGGGASKCILTNCTLIGNSASSIEGNGGGAAWASLNNCILIGNWAAYGGGAFDCTLDNCTISGNSASRWSGGAYSSILQNCILYGNLAVNGANYDNGPTGDDNSLLHYCCTTPLPTNGTGNITNEPVFVDMAGGNFRLQAGSPCINAGNNAYVVGSTDFDGRPRIVGARVDMGACEFQGEFTNWLAQFALPTDGSADFTDPDGDGFNNYQEYRCGTDPTNALSFLHLLPPALANSDVTLTWPSVSNRNYFLEWSTDLSVTPAFLPLATNLPGQPGTTTFTHTNGATVGPRFYRVGVP